MKKTVLKKLAVLGTIGIMTMANSSAAFAAEHETIGNYTLTYMSENEAIAKMEYAQNNGTTLYTTDGVVVQQGDNTYEYQFFKTDAESVHEYFDNESLAKKYIEEQHIHNASIENYYLYDDRGLPYTIKEVYGQEYYGNLKVTLKNTNVDTINLNLVNGIDTIHPDGLAIIEYSVNDGGDCSQISFKSYDESVATVEWDGNCAYITGHSPGTTIIRAYALNGTTNFVRIEVSE